MLKRLVLLFFAIVFLAKFMCLGSIPFSYDETLYAEMVSEELEHPSFLPTYLGYPAPWKPGLSFFAYSLFLPLSSAVFDSLEYIYRLPVLVFGLLNAYLFYLLAKRFYGEDAALLSSLLFYASLSDFYIESRLLMEPFMLTTILASLIFYTNNKMPDSRRFALAALFAILSAFTKSVIGLVIPAFAILYIFQFERKKLSSPAFLFSLLAVPLGLLIFWLSLSPLGLAEKVFFTDTGKMFVYDYSAEIMNNITMGATTIVIFTLPILAAGAISLLSRWKGNYMFAAWFLLAFAMLLLGQRWWYYYYVTPPICLFAALLMLKKDGRMDGFAIMLVAMLAAISVSIAVFTQWNPNEQEYFQEAKGVGLSLSGKDNVLFLGQYSGNTVSITYKILDERHREGRYRDFGYILLDGIKHNMSETFARDFVQDYWRDDYDMEEHNFAAIFWHDKIFRKNTNISEFDYVVVSPPVENLSLDGYWVDFPGNYSTVYKRAD